MLIARVAVDPTGHSLMQRIVARLYEAGMQPAMMHSTPETVAGIWGMSIRPGWLLGVAPDVIHVYHGNREIDPAGRRWALERYTTALIEHFDVTLVESTASFLPPYLLVRAIS